jgi:hypothetical protein
MPIEKICDAQGLAALPAEHVEITAALRIFALMRRMNWCAMAAVAERIGMRAAAHLHLLMEEIGAAWPDPFCVSPPCSPRLSHDEATLVQMIGLAGRGDRPGFDRLLCELLPGDVRERMFVSASTLSAAMQR